MVDRSGFELEFLQKYDRILEKRNALLESKGRPAEKFSWDSSRAKERNRKLIEGLNALAGYCVGSPEIISERSRFNILRDNYWTTVRSIFPVWYELACNEQATKRLADTTDPHEGHRNSEQKREYAPPASRPKSGRPFRRQTSEESGRRPPPDEQRGIDHGNTLHQEEHALTPKSIVRVNTKSISSREENKAIPTSNFKSILHDDSFRAGTDVRGDEGEPEDHDPYTFESKSAPWEHESDNNFWFKHRKKVQRFNI